jgi:hypothetical protein
MGSIHNNVGGLHTQYGIEKEGLIHPHPSSPIRILANTRKCPECNTRIEKNQVSGEYIHIV